VSDSITAGSNNFWLPKNQEEEQTNFEPQKEGLSSLRSVNAAGTGHHLNLREALEWLLGSPHNEDDHLTHEDKAARRNRRMELLLWLLNLEPRLAPYGDY
jgi:hypothetical protein